MPVYLFECGQCGRRKEAIQSFSGNSPLCCGQVMNRLPTAPAKIDIKGTYRKGYKEGYQKDYQRRLREAKS